MEKRYVAYYRVSTQKQGNSGLGLLSQKEIVQSYIARNGNCLASEHIEIESGKSNNRPQLLEAISKAKETGAVLCIAKLDRLSRNLAFIATLMESRVKFVACDLPDANELTIHIFGAMAEFERKRISERTRNALQAKKLRDPLWKPGTPANLTNEARNKGQKTIIDNARNDLNAKHAWHFIEALREKGLSFSAIAEKLSEEGYKTRNGSHNWHPVQVWNIWKRFAENSGESKRA